MHTLVILSRMLKSLKIEITLIISYSFILVFYCSNPYAINPIEFTLYTKYLLPIGFFVWFLFSSRLNILLLRSIPHEWLVLNKLVHRPMAIQLRHVSTAFLCFLAIQIILGIVIATVNMMIFSSGFDNFILTFKLYIIYFMFPLLWSWIAGGAISCAQILFPPKKAILFSFILLTWITLLFCLEYRQNSFNIFIDNRWPYIDPIHSLAYLEHNLLFKLIFLTCSILVVFIFIMIKHKIIVSLISIAFLFFITYGVYSAEYNLQIDKKLLANDYQLYQQVEDTVKNNTEMTDNWRITGVDLEAESEYPIRIRLSIDKGSDLVRFSINEQFSISHVLSQNKNLEFEQYRNVVEIATNGVQSLTIYYEETLGTSFFPITSNVIYLPAESNWYPQYKNLKQYTVDSIGNFHSNVETNSCKRNEIVFGQSNYSWQGNNPNCLSIIKGPYERLEIHDTDLVIYQPFTTKRSNYVELKEHLLVVQNELCQLFYSSKDKLNCSVDPHSIVITPKSIGTDAFSLYDSTTHNGQYTFYVNPFLDVNDRPVTTHLMELSTFLIPYRLLEDEKLSILVSQYLNEKLDIETTGYINWVRDSSSITSEEWDDFSGLSIGDKEKILKHMFSEPRSGG